MKRILAAVDGSEASLHAARQALDIARAFKGTLTLVHAVPFFALPTEVPIDTGPLLEESTRAGQVVLADAAAALGDPSIGQVCLKGGNSDALIEYAEREGFDLVVVGSKGRNAVSRMLIGSTTDRLVHSCRKPVLVVR